MKRVNDLGALLKQHSREKNSKEEYAGEVLKDIDSLMKLSGDDRLSFSSDGMTIGFERDPVTGSIHLSVDGVEIAPDNTAEMIWSIDHPDDECKKTIPSPDPAEAKKALERIADRSIEETLKEVGRQAEMNRRSLLELVKILLQLCEPELNR